MTQASSGIYEVMELRRIGKDYSSTTLADCWNWAFITIPESIFQ